MSAPMNHVDARIAELLLGDVSDEERPALEAHLATCRRCADELAAAADAFAQVALALPAEAPPPSLRARILDGATPPRLVAMIDKLADLFDVSKGRARALLARLDDAAAWAPGPVPASWIMLVDGGGPKVAGAFCGFVKMGPGVRWPAHKHLGTEHMLVLEGGFAEDGGVEVHPGQVHVMREGSEHAFTIFPDETCVAAAVVFGGVEFSDPRFSLGPVSK